MKLYKFILGAMGTNCYFISDEVTGQTAIVDPADSFDVIKDKIEKFGLRVKYIILTHAHFDHMLALEELRDYTKAPLCVHTLDNDYLSDPDKTCMSVFGGRDDVIRSAEILLEEGSSLFLGKQEIKVIHTPGHTLGSICLIFDKTIISGDTLFRGDIGRYDLYGGDFRTLCNSLKRLSEFDDDYRLCPGHGMSTTLGEEKLQNIYLM